MNYPVMPYLLQTDTEEWKVSCWLEKKNGRVAHWTLGDRTGFNGVRSPRTGSGMAHCKCRCVHWSLLQMAHQKLIIVLPE